MTLDQRWKAFHRIVRLGPEAGGLENVIYREIIESVVESGKVHEFVSAVFRECQATATANTDDLVLSILRAQPYQIGRAAESVLFPEGIKEFARDNHR